LRSTLAIAHAVSRCAQDHQLGMDTKSVIARFACSLQLLNWGLQNASPVGRRGGDDSVLSRFSAVKWHPADP
jgi:hypothetical protein